MYFRICEIDGIHYGYYVDRYMGNYSQRVSYILNIGYNDSLLFTTCIQLFMLLVRAGFKYAVQVIFISPEESLLLDKWQCISILRFLRLSKTFKPDLNIASHRASIRILIDLPLFRIRRNIVKLIYFNKLMSFGSGCVYDIVG